MSAHGAASVSRSSAPPVHPWARRRLRWLHGRPPAVAPSPAPPPPPRLWRRHQPWLNVLLVAAAVFLTPLRSGDLQQDAPMYAWFGYRIHATGDWLNLYFDFDGKRPYFNKPPLQFW